MRRAIKKIENQNKANKILSLLKEYDLLNINLGIELIQNKYVKQIIKKEMIRLYYVHSFVHNHSWIETHTPLFLYLGIKDSDLVQKKHKYWYKPISKRIMKKLFK